MPEGGSVRFGGVSTEDLESRHRSTSITEEAELNLGMTRSGSMWWGRRAIAVEQNQQQAQSVHVKPTPLPKMRLMVLLSIQMVEALSITLLFPFIPFLIRDFGVAKTDDEVGYYAGLVASSYCAAQFVSSYWWGVLSDRFGRRPILLSGMMGTMVCNTAFGMSKTLPQALISRSLAGLLCGNLGVVKTYVGEITDDTNMGRAFSLFGGAWGIATMVGPAIGGMLSRPAVKYPEIFGGTIFDTYPYLLPVLSVTALAFFCFVVGALFLEETLVRGDGQKKNRRKSSVVVPQEDKDGEHGSDSEQSGEGTTKGAAQMNGNGYAHAHTNGDGVVLEGGANDMEAAGDEDEDDEAILDRLAITKTSTVQMNGGGRGMQQQQSPDTRPAKPSLWSRLFGRPGRRWAQLEDEDQHITETGRGENVAMKVLKVPEKTILAAKGAMNGTAKPTGYGQMPTVKTDGDVTVEDVNTYHKRWCRFELRPELRNRMVWTTCLVYALLGFTFIIYDEVFPVWASTPTKNGGLGFNTSKIGAVQIAGGVALLLFQFGIYNFMVQYVGLLRTFRGGFAFIVPVFCGVPFVYYVRDIEWLEWTLLLILVSFRSVGGSMAFTTAMSFINNSVEPGKLASANGLGQSMVSLARTIGPPMGTAIYAQTLIGRYPFPFNFHFTFFLIGGTTVATYLLGLTLPKSIECRLVAEPAFSSDEEEALEN